MTQPLPTALDQLLIKLIASAGTPLPNRQYLNFLNGTITDNPTFAVDGVTVGATNVTFAGGGGGGGGTVFSVPTTIVLDPIGGNDNNPGGPYKTVAKVNSVLASSTISAAVTVSVLSTPGGGDVAFAPQNVNLIDPAGSLTVTGTSGITSAHSGTLTSGTVAIDPSTGTRQTVEATALTSFSPYRYQYLRDITTGAGAWLMNPRTGHLCDTTRPATVSSSPVEGSFASGNSYVIENRVTLNVTAPDVRNNTTATQFGCTFVDLNVGGFPVFYDINVGYYAIRCTFPSAFGYDSAGGRPLLTDCLLNAPVGGATQAYLTNDPSATMAMAFGGIVTTGAELGSLSLTESVYVTGVGLILQQGSSLIVADQAGAQFQDCTSADAAIRVELPGVLDARGGTLWGTGNTGAGVQIGFGAMAFVSSTDPVQTSLTGTGGDFTFRLANGTSDNVATTFVNGSHAYTATYAASWGAVYGDSGPYAMYPATRAGLIVGQ